MTGLTRYIAIKRFLLGSKVVWSTQPLGAECLSTLPHPVVIVDLALSYLFCAWQLAN